MRHHVVGVEITTAKNDESANLLEAFGHSYQFYWPLDTRSKAECTWLIRFGISDAGVGLLLR